MVLIQADDLNSAVHEGLKTLLDSGSKVKIDKANPDFAESLELHPAYLQIDNPGRRVLSLKERKANISATIAETLWVLSGSDKIKDIEPYMPRVKDFSDDGETWRAGYGSRIFRYGKSNINQFEYCLDTLKKDLFSRQAVISLWDPEKECTVGKSVDFPCSNHIQFLYRDGALDLTLSMRSSDCIWGFSHINMFEFTTMLEIMANKLGVPMGRYYHQANSFHIYPRMYERARKIVDCNEPVSIASTLMFTSLKNPNDQTLVNLMDVVSNPFDEDVLRKALFSVLHADRNISTETCWFICLMFIGGTKSERMESGKRIKSSIPHDILDKFWKTDYALALSLSQGFETTVELKEAL